jgi:ribosomal protein S18 acetylase RimI-like enzyme
MEFKTLKNVPVEDIQRAFTDAFSNYAVKQELNLQQFTEMVDSRNFDPENSMGCFINDQLVGFILCGIRYYGHEKLGYDIATGVLDQYQNKGIGKEMLCNLVDLLKANSVRYFTLEVLEGNTAAINLYKNQGFEVIRKLECYEAEKDSLVFSSREKYRFDSNLSKFMKQNTNEYQLYKPTWQNDLVSVGNNIDGHRFLSIEKNDRIICFGFIHHESGRIPQIGVLPAWRNQGLEAILISKLAMETTSEKISFINVEENSYLSETLDNIGITPYIKQFEMQFNFKS